MGRSPIMLLLVRFLLMILLMINGQRILWGRLLLGCDRGLLKLHCDALVLWGMVEVEMGEVLIGVGLVGVVSRRRKDEWSVSGGSVLGGRGLGGIGLR